MKIIQKYAETMAREQSKFIDDAFKNLVPIWKLNILLKFNHSWVKKLLNVDVDIIHEDLIGDFGKRIIVRSGNKHISKKFVFKYK